MGDIQRQLGWRAAITSFSSSTLCTSSTIRPMHTVPRIIGRAICDTMSNPSSVGLAHSTINSMVRDSHSMPPTMPARQRCSFHLEVDVAGADAGDDAGDKTRHRGDAADVDQIAVHPGDNAGDDPHPGAEQDAAGHNGDDAHVNQRSFDVDAGIGAEQREQREDRRDDAELERRMVFFAAVGGTAGCGSGKQTDQHQRGAIKHRQQHFKKGARRVLAAAYGWRQYTTAKGARGARTGGDQRMPSCALPSGVSRSAVARPSKSTSKSSGAKSGGVLPSIKLGSWRCR